MAGADRLTNLAEGNIYADEVIFSRTTPYQRIVLTAWRDDLRLFLNSHLQFSSRDEYRYHEALVHPAMAVAPGRAARARAGRRRRPRPARDPEVPAGRARHARRSRSRGRPPLHDARRAAAAEPRRVPRPARPRRERRRVPVARRGHATCTTSRSSTSPIPRTSRSASSTRRRSTDGCCAGSRPTRSSSCRARRRCSRARRTGASSRPCAPSGARAWPYHVYVPSFGEWGFVLGGRGDWSLPAQLPSRPAVPHRGPARGRCSSSRPTWARFPRTSTA